MGYGSGGYGSGGYGSGGYGSKGQTPDENKYGQDNSASSYGTDNSSDDNYGNENSERTKKQAKKMFGNDKGYVDGIITGYETEQDNTGFIGAWFKSLFWGIPFVVKSKKHIFQLVADEFNSDSSCTEVHLAGEISSGKLNNGERVRVYGTKTLSGAYLAKKIIKSNSNMRVTIKNAVPAFITRAATLLVLAAILGIVTSISGSSAGTGSMAGDGIMNNVFSADLWKQILAGVIIVLTLVFGGKIREMTGLSIKILWIIVAVLVSLLLPEIGAILVVICIIIWAVKYMIGRK